MFTISLILSSIFSLCFTYSKIPLALTVYLSLNTITVAIVIISYIKTSWFSFILIIVFLSGIIVIFTYVSSLSSNQFNPPSNYLIISILSLIIFIFILILMYSNTFYLNTISTQPISFNLVYSPNLHKLYERESALIISILLVYLLITLLVVVKNSSINKAPLRSK